MLIINMVKKESTKSKLDLIGVTKKEEKKSKPKKESNKKKQSKKKKGSCKVCD